ncbi:MAG: DUF3060 domain-containing protein [Pyrinomonadaceae bacterium]
MKLIVTAALTAAIASASSCDLRSETAKREMEKFSGSPTPSISATPTPEPIDPADVVEVDTTLDSATLSVNGDAQKERLNCGKFERVMINGSGSTVHITGACRQIMINGRSNRITADAATEFVFNGSENAVSYSRFVNGQRPLITQNQPGNTVEKKTYEGRPKGKAK